jgi:hypothetical protein
MESKNGKRRSFDDVIMEIIRFWREKSKEPKFYDKEKE